MFIAACYRRFQVDPAAMQRAGRATAGFRLGFSKAESLALQRGGEARTLLRVIAKECLQCWISNALSGLLKTFLTIFERFDQVIDYFVLLLHEKIVAFHAAFACLLLTVHQRMEISLSAAPTGSNNKCTRLKRTRAANNER